MSDAVASHEVSFHNKTAGIAQHKLINQPMGATMLFCRVIVAESDVPAEAFVRRA